MRWKQRKFCCAPSKAQFDPSRERERFAAIEETQHLRRQLLTELFAANAGRAEGIELACCCRPEGPLAGRHVAILPDPSASGLARVLDDGRTGFSGHPGHANGLAALENALRDGYVWPVKLLDALAVRPAFMTGIAVAELTRASFSAEIDLPAFEAHLAEIGRRDAERG